jgi:alpha-L-arabinofuranosidase
MDANGQALLADRSLEQARKLGYRIAVTEWNWNGWWRLEAGKPPLDSRYAKGLGAASLLHAICRNGDTVILATQSMLIGRRWDIAAVHVGHQGNQPPHMSPTGMVTALYSQHHGDRRLAVELTDVVHYKQPYRMGGLLPQEKVAFVDVLATRSDRTVFLHLVHRRFADARQVRIDLSAFTPAGEATLHVMTGRLRNRPAPGEPPGPAAIDRRTATLTGGVLTFDLPPRSVVIAEVPLRR